MSAPAIYAVSAAGPLTYEWRGCADPDQHETDSEHPEFVCPHDRIERYGYGAGESDTAYAARAQREFLALLALKVPATEPALPAALASVAVEVVAVIDHATDGSAEG